MNYFEQIPLEIIQSILSMDRDTLIKTCLLNPFFYQICQDDYLWKQLTIHDFGMITKDNTKNWYQQYIERYNYYQRHFPIVINVNNYNQDLIEFLKYHKIIYQSKLISSKGLNIIINQSLIINIRLGTPVSTLLLKYLKIHNISYYVKPGIESISYMLAKLSITSEHPIFNYLI